MGNGLKQHIYNGIIAQRAGSGAESLKSDIEKDVYNAIVDAGGGGGGGGSGATFIPDVSDEGVISWTNNGGLPNPSPKNIKGPKGDDGEGGPWEDDRATLVAWDNIPAGTNLKGLTWQQILAKQVYPFIEPAFSSFAVSTLTGTMEVGQPVAANGSVSWGISNAGNATANSVTLKDHTNATVFSNEALNASPRAITYASWTSNTATSSTWTISAKSQSGATFTRQFRVTWLFKLFFGESANATLDAAGVQALRSGTLKSSYAGNYAYQAGGYKWLGVPKNLGKPTTFKDVSNNLPVPMEYMGTLSITNTHGIAQDYYLFRTSNVLGGSITIAVS